MTIPLIPFFSHSSAHRVHQYLPSRPPTVVTGRSKKCTYLDMPAKRCAKEVSLDQHTASAAMRYETEILKQHSVLSRIEPSRVDGMRTFTVSGTSSESIFREQMIDYAEVTLSWQTPLTYRQWFSCWRGRGVEVNDLLNMTWVWLKRLND